MIQLQSHTQLGALREPTWVFRIGSLLVKREARAMGEGSLPCTVFLDSIQLCAGQFLPVLDFFTVQS
jgi:hypothetical protein